MAAQEQQSDESKAKPSGKALRVRTAGSTGGFRRAGYAFGPEPTDIPLADLDKAQREAIEAEPMLRVQEVDIGADAGKE